MKQPGAPNPTPETLTDQDKNASRQIKPQKFPTPQELISHYQSKGLDSSEASIKVIEDLQNALVRVISSSRNSSGKKDKLLTDASRKIDAINGRLAVIDMKLASKPGYIETLGIGLVSGAAMNGINAVWPHVLKGIGQIWSAVRGATNPSSSSSS